jgi:hypothetical protein
MKYIKTYESFTYPELDVLDEGLKDTITKAVDKGKEFAKGVWDATKRESRETQEMVNLLAKLVKGDKITDTQKAFIKAQAVDLVKVLPLIAIQGIPLPIPITPFLIYLGKKVGFDILPNSHTKVDYAI